MKNNSSSDNNQATDKEIEAFKRFISVIKTLRHPEDGCPWDLKQTSETLRNSLLEEAYECVEAISNNDSENTKEELGDIMLVAFLITYINQQNDKFSIDDTLQDISNKLIRRHPHVFEKKNDLTTDEILTQWDDIKENVEGKRKKDSVLDGLKEYLPPLQLAHKIQKKAAKVGFDWKNVLDIFEKIDEEKNELLEAIYSGNISEIQNEIGDMLFTVVNISRFMKVDPHLALLGTIAKFKKRFQHIENEVKKDGLNIKECSLEELDAKWNEAKVRLRNSETNKNP